MPSLPDLPHVPDISAQPPHGTPSPAAPSLARTTWRWLRRRWHALLPSPVGLGPLELARIAAGIVLGLLITAWLARAAGTGVWTLGGWQPPTGTLAALAAWAEVGITPAKMLSEHLPWMVASMGATAMLVFATPSSPMAQPWPVLAGTLVAAAVGTLAQRHVGDAVIGCALAVGATVALMAALRCMHPPAAGLAALLVLERVDGTALLLFPIALNVVVLLLCAWVFHRATGVRYPTWGGHASSVSQAADRNAAPTAAQPLAEAKAADANVSDADLNAALRQYGQVLDIGRDDLVALIALANQASHIRRWHERRCAQLMREPAPAVEADVPLTHALSHMQSHGLQALPVVDAQRRVLGVITSDAILAHWANATHRAIGGHAIHGTGLTDAPSHGPSAALIASSASSAAPSSSASTPAPATAAQGWGAKLRHMVRRGTSAVTQSVVGAVQSLNVGAQSKKQPPAQPTGQGDNAALSPTLLSTPAAQCMQPVAAPLMPETPLAALLPAVLQTHAPRPHVWPVVDQRGHLLGIVTADDITRELAAPLASTNAAFNAS